MLSSYLTIFLTITSIGGIGLLALAATRPAWSFAAERGAENWLEEVQVADWRGLPISALVLVCAAKNQLLRIAALDYERSSILAPGVAVIIGLLIPFAALANAFLGGSPALLYCYLLCVLLIACLLVFDSIGWSLPGALLAGAATLMWAIALPLYAIGSLTTHFMGGPLHNAAVAGLIIAAFLYAVMAVSGTMFQRAFGPGNIGQFDAGAIVIVATPLLYVVYWLVLIAASGQNVDVTDRSWLGLGVFVFSNVLFLATVNLMLNQWHISRSEAGGIGIYFVAAGLAGIAAFTIVGVSDPSGMSEWLSIAPMAIWAILPMCLVYCAMVKLIGQIAPGIAKLLRSAFFLPGLVLCVSSGFVWIIVLVAA